MEEREEVVTRRDTTETSEVGKVLCLDLGGISYVMNHRALHLSHVLLRTCTVFHPGRSPGTEGSLEVLFDFL